MFTIKNAFSVKRNRASYEWFILKIYTDNQFLPFKVIFHVFEKLKVQTCGVSARLMGSSHVSEISLKAKISVDEMHQLFTQLSAINTIYGIVCRMEADEKELMSGYFKLPNSYLTANTLKAIHHTGATFCEITKAFTIVQLSATFAQLTDLFWIFNEHGQVQPIPHQALIMIALLKTKHEQAYLNTLQ